jgi:2-haloacid dehalogenase
MLVAAHEDDLDAAKACGLKTAFIERPKEFGPNVKVPQGDLSRFTFAARDLNHLADQMGI